MQFAAAHLPYWQIGFARHVEVETSLADEVLHAKRRRRKKRIMRGKGEVEAGCLCKQGDTFLKDEKRKRCHNYPTTTHLRIRERVWTGRDELT